VILDVSDPRDLALYIRPDRAEKFEVDLSTARSNVSLGKHGLALMCLKKGTGTWTLTLEFSDGSTCSIESTVFPLATEIT